MFKRHSDIGAFGQNRRVVYPTPDARGRIFDAHLPGLELKSFSAIAIFVVQSQLSVEGPEVCTGSRIARCGEFLSCTHLEPSRLPGADHHKIRQEEQW